MIRTKAISTAFLAALLLALGLGTGPAWAESPEADPEGLARMDACLDLDLAGKEREAAECLAPMISGRTEEGLVQPQEAFQSLLKQEIAFWSGVLLAHEAEVAALEDAAPERVARDRALDAKLDQRGREVCAEIDAKAAAEEIGADAPLQCRHTAMYRRILQRRLAWRLAGQAQAPQPGEAGESPGAPPASD